MCVPDIVWHPRDGTSDLSVINSTAINDEYGLRDLPPLSGWALDIGAHIGSVCIPLAVGHPDLSIIAVEPLPENVAVLRQNIASNRNLIGDRLHVYEAAISDHDGEVVVHGDFRHVKGLDDDYVLTNRWIGGVARGPHYPTYEATAYSVRAITLSTLLDGIDEVAFTKTDCETGEWLLFADPAVAKLRYIVGEYHDRNEDALFEALHATHEVTTKPAAPETETGGIGMFWAERR